MKKFFYIFSFLIFLSGFYRLSAQTNYFADGYHGGVYGHYPLYVTKFMTEILKEDTGWRLNLEIEPETWDTVAVRDSENYAAFKKIINTPSAARVEYVNPTYAQSYLYNISAESIIRQFQYGMKKLEEHFPKITFTTYSSEEPCFTSALPQILKSLGFKYAVLKNPNTCWGGYVKAYGAESLNWVGPDGTSILTVPRYSSEAFQKNSTWQTIAWNNSKNYIDAALAQGIKYTVGMCIQDAGWKNGPWLGNRKSPLTQYTTWRNYFSLIKNDKVPDWRLSQEDIKVSLVWGSQILQRIAQEVRIAENKLTMAEKAAALAKLYGNVPYPEKKFDEAWRTLLLSQHHDCWIVPYNRHNGKTWAQHVKEWTDFTICTSDSILNASLKKLNENTANKPTKKILTFNSCGNDRNEIASVELPANIAENISLFDKTKTIQSQVISKNDSTSIVLFRAAVPAMGFKEYEILNKKPAVQNKNNHITKKSDGSYEMETSIYRLIIDPSHGGCIKNLVAKQLNNKEFVSPNNKYAFNTLRGNFFKNGGIKTSGDSMANIQILENGPLRIKLQIKSKIGSNTIIQTIALTDGDKKIDCSLRIDYAEPTGVGENYKQNSGYDSKDLHKAFYNDTSKLLVMFPLNLKDQKVYKDAPLDVTESKLPNTFYNRWDSIKNNIVDNWVDVTDNKNEYGIAVISDHVTSYSHGENFPLSLTVQYAGIGLWGRNYNVDGPTTIRYALVPHAGKWDKAGLNEETINWNEPIIGSMGYYEESARHFIESLDKGLAINAIYYKGNDLYIRIVNNESDKKTHHIIFNGYADQVQLVELNDKIVSLFDPKSKHVSFDLYLPLFAFKTIRLINARP
ncbi:MAG: glycoside hydrolase family 38 C-terminal domain-containing protein [Ginsengibacter sp.]